MIFLLLDRLGDASRYGVAIDAVNAKARVAVEQHQRLLETFNNFIAWRFRHFNLPVML